jgi:hypothetical protein
MKRRGRGIRTIGKGWEKLLLLPQKTLAPPPRTEDLKRRIIEFKATLNDDLARKILNEALTYRTSGGRIISNLVKNDGIEWEGWERRLISETATTRTYQGYTPIVVRYPFSTFRYIGIFRPAPGDEYYRDEGPLYIKVTEAGSSEDWQGMRFTVRPDTDEVALIASLLHLCKNLEDSPSRPIFLKEEIYR